MAYVNIRGRRIYYEEIGAGPDLIMIHGAAQDTLSWRFNISFFSQFYHCVAVDLPGHGKSYLTGEIPINETELYAEFIVQFIKALNLNRPVLMGHSMAGGISFMVAASRPEMVRGIVCVDGAAYTLKQSVSYNDIILDMAELNPTEWFETNFRTLCGPGTDRERIEEIAFDVRRCAPEVAISDLRAFTSFDLGSRLKQIKCPVILVAGEYDWSVRPASVRRTSEELDCPQEFIFLKNVGHFPHTEQPEVFNKEVYDRLLALNLFGRESDAAS